MVGIASLVYIARYTPCIASLVYMARYTSLVCLPTTHGGIHPSWYVHPVYPWVYTMVLLYSRCCPLHGPGCHGAGRGSPGLKEGEIPGYEGNRGLPASKGVRVVRDFCALLLRLSCENWVKDWIDEG